MTDTSPAPARSDVEDNKALAIVGYILPILFFIPLLNESSKNSPFAKFHANQQLILLIVAFAINVVGTVIPFIGWFIILPVGLLMILFWVITGIINAANGQMKELWLIGGYTILK